MVVTMAFMLAAFFAFAAKAQAAVMRVYSSADVTTKIIRHGQSTLDPNWLSFSFDDSAWGTPFDVWNAQWWVNSGIRPAGEWINPSAQLLFLNRDNADDPKVILSTPDPIQYSMVREFARKKFTLPANAQITKAYLYAASDNFSMFWLNGTQVVGTGNSIDNVGSCDGNNANQIEGGIWTIDVTPQVTAGNNILAANLINTTPCGGDHPMGIQFLLYIDYILPAAQNLTYTCAPTGNSVTLNWSPVSGASSYQLRINKDPFGDWMGPGDQNPVAGSNSYVANITPSSNYQWSVQAIAPGEPYPYSAPQAGGPPFICYAPTPTPIPGSPPTLGALNIKAGSGAVTSGATYTQTGLRSDDPVVPSNTGSNFYNPITVTQNVNDNGNPNNIILVGTAFTQTSVGFGGASKLGDLKASADANKGFILFYANTNTSHTAGPQAGTGVGQSGCLSYNFCAGKYYVYYNNGTWNIITNASGYTSPGELYAGVDAYTAPPITPVFDVTFYKNLGSRTWGTYGYLMDNNGTETSTSLTPNNL